MGVLIDFMEELRLRIEKATEAGGTLTDVKDIFVGNFAEARKSNDLPKIVINLAQGTDNEDANKCMPLGTADKIQVEIAYITNKRANNNNKLYNPADESGVVGALENILNAVVINRTTSEVDLAFNGEARALYHYNYSIDDSELDKLKLSIIIDVETRLFIRGAM